MANDIEARIEQMGITLPEAAAPAANYLPYMRSGVLIMTSGQLPFRDGALVATGHLGADLDLAAGQDAAKWCAVNVLAQAKAALGDLGAIKRIVKITVFVASTPDFTDQHLVANGASDFLAEVLGEAGRHARSAVGVASLPLNSAVEIKAIIEVQMATLPFLTARPIAHRGLHDGNQRCWENTISAFDAAIAGRFAIELDMQLSADGVAMVFHDDTLDRLTDETGPVSSCSAAHLGDLRVGGTADRISSLAEVLRHVGGRVPVVVEMKDNHARNAVLAAAVAADLDSYDGAVAVMSFSQDLLCHFRRTRSPVPMGLTAEGIGMAAIGAHQSAFDLGIAFVSYHVDALPNPFVDEARARGLPVITWTVRTPKQVKLTALYADQMTFEGFDPDAN